MKKRITVIILAFLILTGVAGTFWSNEIAAAATSIWNSCPEGRVNDPYPGRCHSYIDTNKDKICDRSQSAPQPSATPTTTAKVTAPVTSTSAVSPSITAAAAADTAGISQATSEDPENKRPYGFIPILLAAAFLYALTWVLSRKKVIRQQLHRKIWNVILLVSALVSVLLGLFLTLNLEFNLDITLPVNMLFWHVEASIIMGIILLFHIVWHWKYFVKIVKAEP
jgi:hypothetical protein